MPVHQMSRMQYQPVQIGNITAQFLTPPQRVAGNQGTYDVRRAVNYDPVTGIISSGQAFLYEAIEAGSGRRVALKQLLDPAEPDARERHARECGFVLSGRRHPHIVTGLERLTDGREEFLVMEWVEGTTLGQEVGQRGPLPHDLIVSRLLTLARVLHFVNTNGFLFRDLNEGNVMVTPQGALIVIDFGGICPVNSGRHTHLLPPSVAPEVARAVAAGRPPGFTPASEVYACGTLGYLMATGQLVPDDRSVQPLVPPRVLNPRLDPALEALLLHALDERPDRRPATPLALVRLLEALAGKVQVATLTAAPAPVRALPQRALPAAVPLGPAIAPVAPPASWDAVRAALRHVHQEASALLTWSRRQAILSLRNPANRLWRGLAAAFTVTTVLLALVCLEQRSSRAPEFPSPTSTGTTAPSRLGTPTLPAADPPPVVASAPRLTLAPDPVKLVHAARVMPPVPRPLLVSVAGIRVNLCTRPSLSGAVVGVVSAPKPLRLLGRWNGWYKVAAPGGTQGYVWGAFLPVEPVYRRGVLRQSVFVGPNRLPAGEKLLLVSVTPVVDTVLLPSGRVTAVPAGAVKVLVTGAAQVDRRVPPLPFVGA